ncbi:MAG: hypothetical protein NXI31_01475 [bacterium]|nr:hypothetical protein [bacterium]
MNLARRATILLATLILGLMTDVAATAAAQDPTPRPRHPTEQVTAERCAECHDREHRRLTRRGHGMILQTGVLPGCETCHGPGLAHTVDEDNDPSLIRLPSALKAREQAALCAKCHVDQIERHGGDPAGFLIAGQTCTDCHSVHGRAPKPTAPGVRLIERIQADAQAEPIGSAACIECHPLRDELLHGTPHQSLASGEDDGGCEKCHGNGSLHADTFGQGRLITRPDRANDGIATCRECHAEVDAVDFHWREGQKPYLSTGVTCTTCHIVHGGHAGKPRSPDAAPATNGTCATCHAEAFATMPGSVHQSLGTLDTPLASGCGACHPGGVEHAASGGRRSALVDWQKSARTEAETCLQCHQDSRTLEHVRRGDHLRHGVSCTDCHGPLHGAKHGHTRDHAEQSCAKCHQAVAAEFRLPNHHPVPEGRMHCSSCHDVHGAGRRGSRRSHALTTGRCVDCHKQYAGPFVFAHQADRQGGCITCHSPHGTPTRRLLNQVNTQQNCLSCHGDFPAFHDQTPGVVFTNCIRCHTEVHGSNHSRYLFR